MPGTNMRSSISSLRRLTVRLRAKAAAAINPPARTRPKIKAHCSRRCGGSLPRTGAIPKQNVEPAATEKPAQSSQSSRRPSTENRTPASTATSAAASATIVLSTSRTCGSSKVGRTSG